MKIVYSLPAVMLCGGVVHHFAVIRRLVARGHHVEIYAPMVADLDLLPPLPASVPIHAHTKVTCNLYSLPSERYPRRFFETFWALTAGLRHIAADLPADADVIHAGFDPNTIAADRMRRIKRSRCGLIQGIHIDPAYFLPVSFRRRYAWLWANAPFRADHLIAVCDALARTLFRRYGKPVTQVGNGVDDELLVQPPCSSLPVDTDGRPYVLFVGSIRQRKGIDVLLAAFSALRERHPDLLLVMAGKGSWETVYRVQAQRLGVEPHVRVLPGVGRADLCQLLDGAAAFAFPSRMEGFGLPPLEAMARGCPVVCTACEGVNEYARDGENCLFAEPNNAQALAQALDRVLTDRELAARLGEGGRKTAQRYTWDQVAERTESAMLACAEHARERR